MHRRPVSLTGRRCLCGAAVEPGRSACLKCRARVRWVRRKIHDHL
jgi:uncharacterized OB-fold protein